MKAHHQASSSPIAAKQVQLTSPAHHPWPSERETVLFVALTQSESPDCRSERASGQTGRTNDSQCETQPAESVVEKKAHSTPVSIEAL